MDELFSGFVLVMAVPSGLVNWVNSRISASGIKYDGTCTSLADGMVLCAIIHSYEKVRAFPNGVMRICI